MTDKKRKLIYKMFDSIGHEVMHKMGETWRGDIVWRYEDSKDYLNIVPCNQPKCKIFDCRPNAKHRSLLLPSYRN